MMIYASIHGIMRATLKHPEGELTKYRLELQSLYYSGSVTIYMTDEDLLKINDAISGRVQEIRSASIKEATHEAV